MAKKKTTSSRKQKPTQTTGGKLSRFDSNITEDIQDYHLQDNVWTHARNAITNSASGDMGSIGNEPANIFCAAAPYNVIGTIHIQGDRWAIFSTDDSNSEIGLFDESACTYTTIVNDACLNFNRANLITGISRENYDCRWNLYWADGENPDRTLTIDIDVPANNEYTNPESSIPWIQDCEYVNDCFICENTPALDCDKIRLEELIKPLCFRVEKGASGGTLLNGSYYVVGKYLVDGEEVGDFSLPSNVQPLFTHNNTGASLDIYVEDADQRFDEFRLVLVAFFSDQTVPVVVGTYSTRQEKITLDFYDNRWPAVSGGLDAIPLRTTVANKSDAIFRNGNYAIRVGPTGKFDFNYQPLANQIRSKWVSVEYPEDYYHKGGNKVGNMRDEVYAYYIRWVYDTGDKSASYHIPGRPQFVTPTWVNPNTNSPELESGTDLLDTLPIDSAPVNWLVHNTAVWDGVASASYPQTADDGVGQIIAEGYMGYWESSEIYDDDRPEIWNAGVTSTPYPGTSAADYDLCGKPIRHHKFPDNSVHPNARHFSCEGNNMNGTGCKIRVLGVKFENVLPPVYNPQDPPSQWIPIPGIVGYEILRGTRVGNESVIAKGLINNMFEYDLNGTEESNINITVGNRKGLYPNYPYNDLAPDPYLSTEQVTWEPGGFGGNNAGDDDASAGFDGQGQYQAPGEPISDYRKDVVSFHSPNTQYTDPFLDVEEIKIYGQVAGNVEGSFTYPNKHPKHKMVTDVSFIIGVLVGLGYAVSQNTGKRSRARSTGRRLNLGGPQSVVTGTLGPAPVTLQFLNIPSIANATLSATAEGTQNGAIAAYSGANTSLLDAITALNTAGAAWDTIVATNTATPAWLGQETTYNFEDSDVSQLPTWVRIFTNINTLYGYFVEGLDTTLNLIRAFSQAQQYALQYQSHCKYSRWINPQNGNRRKEIDTARYISPHLTEFTDDFKINNLDRNRHVAIRTTEDITDPASRATGGLNDVPSNTVGDLVVDNSKFTIKSYNWQNPGSPINYKDPIKGVSSRATSHYVGLKRRLRNQYGQINSVVQIPLPECFTSIEDRSTKPLFGGDTYIGRHTEKNTMPFFYDWLYGELDETEFNYRLTQMIPYVNYWLDSRKFEWSDFIQSIGTAFSNLFSGGGFWNNLVTPSDLHCFDRDVSPGGNGFFIVKNAFFYLFNSGARDFFVESTYNVDLRDWGDAENERHYDPYNSFTDLRTLFNTDYIRFDNVFKYDSNLSHIKLFNNYINWGNVQPRSYDPNDAKSCFEYKAKRMIYSLPQNQTDFRRDNWRIFLPLNYKDFVSRPVAVKPIFTSGAVILFENESPIVFKGVEELQTTGTTKITIGDAGLFNQPLQNMTNTESFYEYGSCQNSRAIINTPYGTFYMSQNQGKIMILSGNSLKEISAPGQLKWWFSNYLPYKLTDQFPDFELLDNPVIGLGCQAIYDNENMIVYFCKRDFVLRDGINPNDVEYIGSNRFLIRGIVEVELGDPRYFTDASWTVSFDVKGQKWIGWHDWHPNLLMGGKVYFMSVKDDGVWVHNKACDLYCNYYGVDYPFEIEFPSHTIVEVNTLRSVEYQMEVYKYNENCYDRFHDLDFNFDQAVIYNSEQCSGMLNLNLMPKNNAPAIVQYPIINIDSIDILYSKEEQKYRFNQFWDITDDRGEFTGTERVIWNTQPNGYVRLLNPLNLNYDKLQTEHKRFRHYKNSVFLRRRVSGNRKMLLSLTAVKTLKSPR